MWRFYFMEVWKDIEGFNNVYQISSLGNVRSLFRVLTRSNGIKQTVKGKILKTFVNSNGYEFAVFQIGKKTKNFAIHRLVAKSFIDNNYNKYAVNHINGIKTDNRVENLEWATKSENEIHARKIGLKCTKGEKASNAILTEEQVLCIRENKNNNSQYFLASKFNVSRSCIASIIKNRTWKHL